MTKLQTMTTVLLLTFAATAAAGDNGIYVDIQLGQTWLGEDGLTAETTELPPGTAAVDYEGGFAAGVAVGWFARSWWRIEAECLYRTDELEVAEFADGTTLSSGDMSSVMLAANTLFDIPLWRGSGERSLSLALGGGVGWIQAIDLELKGESRDLEFSGDDFGFQYMAALDWRFSPDLSAGVEVRFFEASDVKLDGDGGRVTSDYSPANISVGLRYRF